MTKRSQTYLAPVTSASVRVNWIKTVPRKQTVS